MNITPTQLPTYSRATLSHALHQTPLKKITGVALLCLLAIGALFAARSFFSKRTPEPKPSGPNNAPQRRFSNTPRSQCQLTMVWMDALLQHEDKTMLLTPFSSKSSATVRQPINEQITHLKNLYPKYVQSLVDQIQSASENPWVNYVQSLAHKSDSPDTPWAGSPLDEVLIQCMSALYTISRLTLDEVNSLEALTNQSEYSCQTFYLMGMFYHMIRGAPIWNQERATFVCSNPIPEGYAALFYERGTVQSCWRTLYNDYCERMETCAGTEQPKNLGVPIQWMQQDTNPQTFTPCTDRGFFTF